MARFAYMLWYFVVFCWAMQVVSFNYPCSLLTASRSICYMAHNSDSSPQRPQQKLLESLKSLSVVLPRVVGVFAAAGALTPYAARATADIVGPPEITHRVYLDIKIANYTEESVGTNRGARGSGRLLLGLYGKAAPRAAAYFLALVRSDGSTGPSLRGLQLERVTADGVLEAGGLPGVESVVIAGSPQAAYQGTVLDQLGAFVEASGLSHARRGLMTRIQGQGVAASPFGITLRANAKDLDAFHEVFGEVLDDGDAPGVLDALAGIPTYSSTPATGYLTAERGEAADGLLERWFGGQRAFYRGAAQALGDQRAVDRTGVLLRRVKVLAAGEISPP